ALEMMEEAGSSAEENAARKQEQAEVRAAFQQAGQHLKMMALVQLMLAGVFIAMIFLTNTYPFEISLAALLLYVGLEAWSVVSEGELPGLMSCLIVLVIAGNLAAGVHAGWQIRALRAAK
ncbi:MAG: hypothetical protein KIS92_12495, partial [Planctomycetota bacterium]|nr:hypothetical protein [Planctomycetota bacterium]